MTKGDVSEGIFAAAIYARFINKNKPITKNHVYDVIKKLKKNRVNYTTSTKTVISKSIVSELSENNDSPLKDAVILYVRLAFANFDGLVNVSNRKILDSSFNASVRYANSQNVIKWSKLLYNNDKRDSIRIISDGIGNQKGTKVDVRVLIDKEPIDLNISLKAGDAKKFGQVGGVGYEKMQELFGSLFNINIKRYRKKYLSLFDNGDREKIIQATSWLYATIAKYMNDKFKSDTDKGRMIGKMRRGIVYHATLNEDLHVTLVHLEKSGKANVYDFKKLPKQIKKYNFESKYSKTPDGYSSIKILNADADPKDSEIKKTLISVKTMCETSKNPPYWRNFIEKGGLMREMIAEEA